MTTNRSRSTTQTHTKSPKRSTSAKDSKQTASSSKPPAVRSKPKRQRPPRRVSLEQIQLTFAAAKARDMINELFVDDYMAEYAPSERHKALQFLVKYFRSRGVRVTRKGHVVFPTGACTGVDLEHLIKESYFKLEDFLDAMAKEADIDLLTSFVDTLVEVGWRQGFIWGRDPNHGEQWLVPIVVGLNVSTGQLYFDGRGDRVCVRDKALSLAEQAFASQLPEVWKAWQTEKARRSLMCPQRV